MPRTRAALALVAGVVGLAGCASSGAPPHAGTHPSAAVQLITPARAPVRSAVRHRSPARRRARASHRAGTLSVWVRRPVALLDRPRGSRLALLGVATPFRSARVLPVVGRRAGWLAVITPELANGRVGWIRARGVTFLRNAYTVRISLHRREAVVLRGARAVQRFTVGIGGPGSPTPVGRYAVTDRLYMRGTRAYGCCVLALSGHQPRTPPEWTGGDRLAIHGTDEPSTVGRAASLGCLRARRADALRLVRTVPLGTPVLIAA